MSKRFNYPQGDPIVVERREIIATINPDPMGSQSMITAAFTEIGKYFSDHDDLGGAELQFTYFERTFRGTLEPVESLPIED